jgi:hypothetical protein
MMETISPETRLGYQTVQILSNNIIFLKSIF